MLYFILPAIAYEFGFYEHGENRGNATAVSQEVYELLFALGLLLHAALTYRKLWVLRNQTTSGLIPSHDSQIGGSGASSH